MDNDSYTLLDAFREEIETMKELEAVYTKEEKHLLANDYSRSRRSLERILNRFEKGYEYYMGINAEGYPQLKYRQTNKHLVREYPAVAKAKRNLDVIVDLTKGNTDV